jgi:hypothetical protein
MASRRFFCPRLLATAWPALRARTGRRACVVRASVAVGYSRAATGGVTRAQVTRKRVPAVGSPPVAAIAGDALPLGRGGFSAVLSRIVVDLRSPHAHNLFAAAGDRPARARRCVLEQRRGTFCPPIGRFLSAIFAIFSARIAIELKRLSCINQSSILYQAGGRWPAILCLYRKRFDKTLCSGRTHSRFLFSRGHFR